MDDKQREKNLELAIKNIEKEYGKGSIMILGENRTLDIETSSTGSLS